MARTTIEWTGRSLNTVVGCSIHSPGCAGCYAMRQAARIERMNPALEHYRGLTQPSKAGPVWTGKLAWAGDAKLTEPLRVRKPAMWFVNSMSDLFHEDMPDEWIDKTFAMMALAPQHTFQVLTKRSARMRDYLSAIDAEFHASPDDLNERFGEHCVQISGDPCAAGWFEDHVNWPLPNVWLGVSVEDQKRAEERIPDLLATPAAVRWISAEPLLGPLSLAKWVAFDQPCRACGYAGSIAGAFPRRDAQCPRCGTIHTTLDWVVAGGESGKDARPMHPDWARSLRDQCAASGVPYFFKQHGAYSWHEIMPGGRLMPPMPIAPFSKWNRWEGDRLRKPDPGESTNTFMAPGLLAIEVGKKAAGRLLDGVEHNAMPEARR
ncbi:hypothetical protein [Microcystis phage Mwe-JY25]